MDQIEKELYEQLKNEGSAFEMATDLGKANNFMMNRSFSLLEHFLKVCLYPGDINQNKWRNEIATKMKECGAVKNTSTNKKFNSLVYRQLFTTFCSNIDELKEQVDMQYKEFLEEGFKELDISKLPYEDMFNKLNSLADRALVLMTSKQLFTRDEYRKKVVDIVL